MGYLAKRNTGSVKKEYRIREKRSNGSVKKNVRSVKKRNPGFLRRSPGFFRISALNLSVAGIYFFTSLYFIIHGVVSENFPLKSKGRSISFFSAGPYLFREFVMIYIYNYFSVRIYLYTYAILLFPAGSSQNRTCISDWVLMMLMGHQSPEG